MWLIFFWLPLFRRYVSYKSCPFNYHFNWHLSSSVAHQAYRVAVHEEPVILGNDVLVKCNIQSYVTDFVRVVEWVDSEGHSFSSSQYNGNWFNLVTEPWLNSVWVVRVWHVVNFPFIFIISFNFLSEMCAKNLINSNFMILRITCVLNHQIISLGICDIYNISCVTRPSYSSHKDQFTINFFFSCKANL